jgi:spermidine synthase
MTTSHSPQDDLMPDENAADTPGIAGAPVVLDRRTGPYGEVVLRRHGELLQIIANGCFLMDTSDGRSERLLVDAALAALGPLDARPAPHVLIGGLGVGFSLAHAAADPRWGRITVVERESAVVDWHRSGPLSELTAEALADPRCDILTTDLITHVNERSATYDALCLDIDNGPHWTVTQDNKSLYSQDGIASCARVLRPGGVLAVWSARPSPEFEGTLRNAGFFRVRTEEVPVARGVPDAVHLGVRPG